MQEQIFGLWITKDGGENWTIATYEDIKENVYNGE